MIPFTCQLASEGLALLPSAPCGDGEDTCQIPEEIALPI